MPEGYHLTPDMSDAASRLFRPRVVDDPKLDEEAELVGADPLPDNLVPFEVHDGHYPLIHRLPCWRPTYIASGVGATEGRSEDHRLACGDQLFDFETEVRKGLVVRRTGSTLAAGPVPNPFTCVSA